MDDENLAAARDRIRHLETALENSRAIGIAVGIIMARKFLDRDSAFTVLVGLSQKQSRRLALVAERIVETGLIDDEDDAASA